MAALDDALEMWMPGLTGAPAYPHLRGQLAVRWVDGTAPRTVIEEATWYRGRDSLLEAEDPAAALAWRVSGTTRPSHWDAPLPWLPDIPPALRQEVETSAYLDRLTRRVEQLAERVTDEARQARTSDRTSWQRTLPPDVDSQLVGDLAVWRATRGIPATDPRPAGPAVMEPELAKHQLGLVGRLMASQSVVRPPKPVSRQLRVNATQQEERHRAHYTTVTDGSVRR